MASTLIYSKNPLFPINLGIQYRLKDQTLFPLKSTIRCSQQQSPKNAMKEFTRRKTMNPVIISPDEEISLISNKSEKSFIFDRKEGFFQVGNQDMMVLSALGYYVNGFRGFPWLALNFHMAHNLNMHPSTLQLVQNSGNLPMVAKPFYGILSDALYIGGAHRIPYISIGGKAQNSFHFIACILLLSPDILWYVRFMMFKFRFNFLFMYLVSKVSLSKSISTCSVF